MSTNNSADNSQAAAIQQAQIAHQNGWPAPQPQLNKTADYNNNSLNEWNRLKQNR